MTSGALTDPVNFDLPSRAHAHSVDTLPASRTHQIALGSISRELIASEAFLAVDFRSTFHAVEEATSTINFSEFEGTICAPVAAIVLNADAEIIADASAVGVGAICLDTGWHSINDNNLRTVGDFFAYLCCAICFHRS